MFCSKCGKQQADNAVFCSSCGNPLTQAGAADAQPEGITQATANMPQQPDVPPAAPPPNAPPVHEPKKPNTALIVILSVAAVLIIGAVITFVFILPSSQPVSGTLPSATPSVSANQDDTAGTGPVALRVYAAPTIDNGSSIASVLPGKTWVLSGIAHNPDQIKGAAGRYRISDFSGNATRLVFSADESSLTITEPSDGGGSSAKKMEYTVSGMNYCDSARDGQGNTMRFYIATDGNLYRTIMSGNDTVSDYAVFTPSS